YAEAALASASHSKDAEVARRARDVLREFRWGIYPNTPPAVVALIRRYQTAKRHQDKEAIVQKLFAAGAAGCPAPAKIAVAEPDDAVRATVFAHIGRSLTRTLPEMLAEGNFNALEDLLEVALAADPRTGAPHYAAYWLLRGKLDERIAHFAAKA